jgi:hypothetical protein
MTDKDAHYFIFGSETESDDNTFEDNENNSSDNFNNDSSDNDNFNNDNSDNEESEIEYTTVDVDREYINKQLKMFFNNTDNSREKSDVFGGFSGGDNKTTSIVSKEDNSYSKMKDYKPILTTSTISIFEYVRVVTCLAEALFEMKSICKYVEDLEINYVINPCELAFKLLEENKFDAVIDRKCEKVLYSNLKVNQKWKDLIIEYYENHHKAMDKELISVLT